jgi:NAD-dependent deacetylase
LEFLEKMMEALNQQIERGAKLIRAAHNVVAMTGAGISTPSGIPDFRSPDSGLWEKIDPLTVASIFSFRQNPDQFYGWIHPLANKLLEARPNPAHYALAALESEGKLHAVITQNIDDLHGKAGSRNIFELHGSLRELTCIQCYQVQDSTRIIRRFVQDGQTPRCECGGVLKPNVILFGEQLPVREFVAAQMAVKAADLMLVVGSSLETAPASDLPELALENGIKLVIVNYYPTYLDDRAEVVIHANVAEVLPRILDLAVA